MLIASRAPGWAIFLGKAVAAFLLLLIVEFICLPVFGLFYNIRWTDSFGSLVLVIVLATWGITVVGTAFSAVTVNVRVRELMLPVLLYPMIIPLLIGAMEATTVLLSGEAMAGDNLYSLQLLVVFDVIYTALALYLIDYVLVV